MLSYLKGLVAQSSQKAVAKDLGISPQTMNDLIRGRRDISVRLAEKLGFHREVTYRKIA